MIKEPNLRFDHCLKPSTLIKIAISLGICWKVQIYTDNLIAVHNGLQAMHNSDDSHIFWKSGPKSVLLVYMPYHGIRFVAFWIARYAVRPSSNISRRATNQLQKWLLKVIRYWQVIGEGRSWLHHTYLHHAPAACSHESLHGRARWFDWDSSVKIHLMRANVKELWGWHRSEDLYVMKSKYDQLLFHFQSFQLDVIVRNFLLAHRKKCE